MICSADAPAQTESDFRSPEIPALRSLGGRLISAPTTPQTTLQSIAQESPPRNQTPLGSNRREYQFGSKSAGEFRERLPQQEAIEFSGDLAVEQLNAQLRQPDSNIKTDPNFNGFTPRSSDSLENQKGSFANDAFDSEALKSGIAEFFKSQSGDFESGDDSLEQLPPAMNETEDGGQRSDQIIQRFPNGNKRIVRTVAQDDSGNFSNHGPWEAFDLKGNSVAAGVFKRGVMQGQWRRQHASREGGLFATEPFNLFQGPYLSVANFKDGKLDGIWTIYDRFRSKIFEITYTKGVRNGTATWWYPNRAKMREATFKDGLLNGMILGWDDAEKLTRREEYVDGRRIVRNVTFYRPKIPKQEEFYLDSKLEPEGEDNWWDAKPTPYLPRGSKVQNGGAAQWYENGQLKHQGQFKEGQPVGRFVWWHANGNKSIQGLYVEGMKNRTWTWWHPNGMKKTEGAYKDDQAIGVWRAWYADGSLRNSENFSLETDGTPNKNELNNEAEATEAELNQPRDSGKSVIVPDGSDGSVGQSSEELPQPLEEIPEMESDPVADIEGHDFGDSKTDIDSDAFRDPINPRDIDPFGELDIDSQEDGTIPEEYFKQPESNLFRAPKIHDDPQKSKGQPVSDPFGDQLFQSPGPQDLTTKNPKNSLRR